MSVAADIHHQSPIVRVWISQILNLVSNAFQRLGAALLVAVFLATVALTGCGGGGGGGGGGTGGGGTGGGGSGQTGFVISGVITPASLGAGVQVALSGAGTGTTTTDASGNYTFSGRANGGYTVTPTRSAANV